jgi:hypothetical protein
MPRLIILKKIRKKNPKLDWNAIRKWRRLRDTLIAEGLEDKDSGVVYPPSGRRARIVDDPAKDSRLVRLRRE